MAVLSVSRSTLASPAKYNSLLQASDVTPEELGGMVLLTPTSIAYTGTSASIGANGSVEFTACSSLSLNGVFSADYDNYMISMRHYAYQNVAEVFYFRMRVSGADNSTASSYTSQSLLAYGTTVTNVNRWSEDKGRFTAESSSSRSGVTATIYGPYLTQPTALRSVGMIGWDSATLIDYATTHNQSTSYDGITFIAGGGLNDTGLVSIYGLVGA